ncbi:MAG TPA: VanZ family protein [bacterium]|nr:VanZ family protein [bacterium]
MKKIFFKCLYFTPSVIYAYLIYYFSAINKPQIFKPPFPHFDKLLHFAEYFFFAAVLNFSYSRVFNTISKIKILICIMLTIAIYGALDEWHQSFFIYRSADIIDYLFDVLGGSAMCGILYFFEMKKMEDGKIRKDN